jgi:hypothetical protein
MAEEYDQILEVVAKNPGTTIEEITDLARDHGITNTAVPVLVSMALSNDDLLEFSGRHWVMRTGKYRHIPEKKEPNPLQPKPRIACQSTSIHRSRISAEATAR